jgi:hypothetical protein
VRVGERREFPVILILCAACAILPHMRDRKAYWREYQQKRYARIKAAMTFEAIPNNFYGPIETFDALFVRLCAERGIVGHAQWKAKSKFKREFEKNFRKHFFPWQWDTIKNLLKAAKTNARNKSLEFSLEIKHLFPLPTMCPILNIPLDYTSDNAQKNKIKNNKPSLDRINNARGYTKDNVQIISWRANRLKNDATLKELRLLGKWAESLF